jgi:hypothetical protein
MMPKMIPTNVHRVIKTMQPRQSPEAFICQFEIPLHQENQAPKTALLSSL